MTTQTKARLDRRSQREARKMIFNAGKIALAFGLWFATFAVAINI